MRSPHPVGSPALLLADASSPLNSNQEPPYQSTFLASQPPNPAWPPLLGSPGPHLSLTPTPSHLSRRGRSCGLGDGASSSRGLCQPFSPSSRGGHLWRRGSGRPWAPLLGSGALPASPCFFLHVACIYWVSWGWGCGRGWRTGPVLRFACAWKALGCAQSGTCDQLPASPCDSGRVCVHAQDVPEEVRFLTCRRVGRDPEGPSPGGPVRPWPASRDGLEGGPRAQLSAGAVGLGAQAARWGRLLGGGGSQGWEGPRGA